MKGIENWIPIPRFREDKLHGSDGKANGKTFYETISY